MEKENVYVITLLPENKTLKLLNGVKKYFYTNDYKFKRKISTSNSHLTVSEFKEPKSWNKFENNLRAMLSGRGKIEARVCCITDEIKCTEKYPEGEGWVALLFDDETIKKLYLNIDHYLTENGISLNREYIAAIVKLSGRELSTFDCIANHVNLCNHCRPEKIKEAKEYIDKMVPDRIIFDKVVIRKKHNEEELIWIDLA